MEWYQPVLATEFQTLKDIRDIYFKSLDIARSKNIIRSSLEAVADIETNSKGICDLIQSVFTTDCGSNYTFSDFLIVSEASVNNRSPMNEECTAETREVEYKGQVCDVTIVVRPAVKFKCPRCWKYTSENVEELCGRCRTVFGNGNLNS